MTGFSDVFDSLQAMSQLQLLMAFVACTAYAFAQGNLLARKGQRLAWFTTVLAALGFALESDDWTHAIVLLGFAVAGMGSFVAIVWLTSRALGFRQASAVPAGATLEDEASTASSPEARRRTPAPGDHAHSV